MADSETGVAAICAYTGVSRDATTRALGTGELAGETSSPPRIPHTVLDRWLRARAVEELLLARRRAQFVDQCVDVVTDSDQLA